MTLAGLSVFDNSANKTKVKLNRINDPLPIHSLENITDENILSYFSSEEKNCFIAYDLGKLIPISKIVFSPRNDDNYVWPGDEYELFYLDGINGLKSLGVKTATKRELNFRVPDNALFWLHNWTKGREEQVFIYKNMKQYFTVDL